MIAPELIQADGMQQILERFATNDLYRLVIFDLAHHLFRKITQQAAIAGGLQPAPPDFQTSEKRGLPPRYKMCDLESV